MGYIKKNDKVCDPARKNSVVFQNSYQSTYIVTEQQPYQVTVNDLSFLANYDFQFTAAWSKYTGVVVNALPCAVKFYESTKNQWITLQSGEQMTTYPYFSPDYQNVVSVDPMYNVEFLDYGNGHAWQRVYRVVGSHQETRYRDAQVTKYHTDWNTRWRKS